jgi:hypothetical protein
MYLEFDVPGSIPEHPRRLIGLLADYLRIKNPGRGFQRAYAG